MEGIGQQYVPKALTRSLVDSWVKVGDKECFTYARRLPKEEGIFMGGSSGAALWGAVKYLKENNLHENETLR